MSRVLGIVITWSATLLASMSSSFAMTMRRPLRAFTSAMLPRIFSVRRVLRADDDDGHVLVDEGDRTVLHLGRRISLGVDVGDLLELERPLERDGEVRSPPEVEEVRVVAVGLGDLVDLHRSCRGSAGPGRGSRSSACMISCPCALDIPLIRPSSSAIRARAR